MAEQLLSQVQDLAEGPIDFKGQALAETLTTVLLAASGAIALLAGYAQQDIYLTLWLGLAGALLTLLIIVPPWPFFNRNPETWLPAGAHLAGAAIVVDSKKSR